MKLLQFSENHRPAYWGTWNKRTPLIRARNPWSKDTVSTSACCILPPLWSECVWPSSLGFLSHFVPLSLETPGCVWCSDGQKCWHFLQKLLDYEVDSDEEWEEEEPGESLSHSEEVRVLHYCKNQAPLALGSVNSDPFPCRMTRRRERMRTRTMGFLYPMGTYLKMKV